MIHLEVWPSQRPFRSWGEPVCKTVDACLPWFESRTCHTRPEHSTGLAAEADAVKRSGPRHRHRRSAPGVTQMGQVSDMPDAARRSATAGLRRIRAEIDQARWDFRRPGGGPNAGGRLPRLCQDAQAPGSEVLNALECALAGQDRRAASRPWALTEVPALRRDALPWRSPRVISAVRLPPLRGKQHADSARTDGALSGELMGHSSSNSVCSPV
jgi:hypothetical protein